MSSMNDIDPTMVSAKVRQYLIDVHLKHAYEEDVILSANTLNKIGKGLTDKQIKGMVNDYSLKKKNEELQKYIEMEAMAEGECDDE